MGTDDNEIFRVMLGTEWDWWALEGIGDGSVKWVAICMSGGKWIRVVSWVCGLS